MPKKSKSKTTNEINEVVKKVKSTFLDAIVREWLNTPIKEWGNQSPLQLIKNGDGQRLLTAIEESGASLKMEREHPLPESQHNDNSSVADDHNIEEDISHRVIQLI